MKSYQSIGKSLDVSTEGTSPPIKQAIVDLQTDLTAIGYYDRPIDGSFGPASTRSVKALTYDLLHNDGTPSRQNPDGNAPVRVLDYNRGRVLGITGTLSRAVADCLADIMADEAFPKLPQVTGDQASRAAIVAEVQTSSRSLVPAPFLLAMFVQESDCRQFRTNGFPEIGLDRNDPDDPDHITSRGFGLGQYTLFHHPPTQSEIDRYAGDAASAITGAVKELRGKFTTQTSGAADRKAEHPLLPLRACRYPTADARYMTDCVTCAKSAGHTVIMTGKPFYPGSSGTYQPTQYYANANYGPTPDRADFGCDWPYAARRYNGDGVNSYHYQTIILRNLERSAWIESK